MTTLNLGVEEIAYAESGKVTTTYDVAEILEEKYHIMRTFIELHEKKIADDLADHIGGKLERLLMGKPSGVMRSGDFLHSIEKQFRDFLDADEMSGILPRHVEAAVAGVSHRKKHPYAKKNKSRPAFIDTGLYQRSFRAWLD